MTISSQVRKAGPFVGNDSSTVFPFTFKVFSSSDMYVVKTDTDLGVDTTLVLNTDYTVSLNADQNTSPGGTITLPIALATGFNLTVTSSLQYLQPTDLTNQGGFYPSVITNALDRLTILCQQLYDSVSRSLKISVSTPAGVSTTLPPPASNKLIGWNPTADALQNMDPTTLATIVAFGTANVDKFSGDGSTTQFALSANPGALNNLDVSIGGVTQTPGADYTWTAGTTLTFTSAPPAGTNNVLVRYMQGLPQGQTNANLVAVQDLGGYYTSANVEDALQELAARQVVNIKDPRFGASGDGVTDDSAAVQAAITYVSSLGGGMVVFPPGATYYLNAQINLCDNLVLWGYGAKLKLGSGWKGLNKPLFKNFSGTQFTAPGTRLASQNISFLGFEIDGQDAGVNGSTVADANMHGVVLCCGGWTASSGVDGLVVRDCYMYSFAGAGVMAWKSSNVVVADNRFLNFFANTSLSIGSCIDFHEVSKAIISGNRINHTALGLSWHGMVVLDWDAGSSDITITGNVITNMNGGDGISCEGNSADNLTRAVITSNIIQNCLGQGVGIDRCVSAIVSDNFIESVGGPAILFTSTEEVVATGNKITTSGLGGIMSAAGVSRANIADNIIQGVSYYDGNYRGEGVSVADGTLGVFRQINISGNVITDTDGAGIYAVCRNPVVDGNNLYNTGKSASLGATLRAAIVCTDFGIVSNNLIVSTGNTHYAVSSGASDFPDLDGNRVRGTFLTAYYYIGYRQTGIAHAISVSIEDAHYDTTTNIFTGRYNGTPAGYWYRGDTMYATLPSASGFIGSVVTATPSTWKTFGAISA